MTHLQNWVPYKLILEPEQALCRWLFVDSRPFSEPFFEDTITRCRGLNRHPFHVTGNLELLPTWAKTVSAIAPTAFIFHISRCGSTLLSQLLGINPGHIVLSEVPFIDDLIRAPLKKHPSADFEQTGMLKAAFQFYGQRRSGKETRLFIKTDSWHVCFYRLLRKAYPEVPFILLYRKPEEVIRSHQKRRGMQAVPGIIEPAVFGFEKGEVTDLDDYMAGVIERYLALFLEINEQCGPSLLVNYNEGMLKVVERVAGFIGIDISDDHAKMKDRCLYHAKYPGEIFSEQQSIQTLPPSVDKCKALYDQLEEQRVR